MEYAAPELLLEPETLEEIIDDPRLRIIDCDVPDQFRRAHLPGAISFLGDHYYKDPDERRFIMKPEQFKQAMESIGIGDESSVVGYDASGSLYATRLWWCLNYYGFSQVKVLNGGWNRWLREGLPVSMAPAPVAAASFTPQAADESMVASAEYIMANLKNPDVVMLDVRSEGEWQGSNDRGNRRAGHMPGAVHLEWLNNLMPDEKRAIKPATDLRQMFESAGVTPEKEIVTICQGGIRATQAAMTLKLLGYPRVRNYDGSFFDWANRDDTPLE